jgi:hypothetical protein
MVRVPGSAEMPIPLLIFHALIFTTRITLYRKD